MLYSVHRKLQQGPNFNYLHENKYDIRKIFDIAIFTDLLFILHLFVDTISILKQKLQFLQVILLHLQLHQKLATHLIILGDFMFIYLILI